MEEVETMMYNIVFRSGVVLIAELPIDEVPDTKQELNHAMTTSPIPYYTGVILDWNEISGCIPVYNRIE